MSLEVLESVQIAQLGVVLFGTCITWAVAVGLAAGMILPSTAISAAAVACPIIGASFIVPGAQEYVAAVFVGVVHVIGFLLLAIWASHAAEEEEFRRSLYCLRRRPAF
jgi:hypothetical protein